MKKINVIFASAFAVLSLTACGLFDDPAPAPVPVPDDNPVQDNNIEDPDMYLENQMTEGDAYPSDYYDFLPYTWVLTHQSGTNNYISFYEDGEWDYVSLNEEDYCFETVDTGYVVYDSDNDVYCLYRNDGSLFEELTYDERGILYSANDYMYCNDVEIPGVPHSEQTGTAGSTYYDQPTAQYQGTWYEVFPDQDINSYYELNYEGEFTHYTDDIEDGTGYIIVSGEYEDQLAFYTSEGDKCFECFAFDTNLLTCPGWSMERWND